MKTERYPAYALVIACALLLLVVLLFFGADSGRQSGNGGADDFIAYRDVYAGSRSCLECHERFYELWSTSFHGQSMQAVDWEFVQRALTPHDTPLVIGDFSYQAFFNEEGAWVEERTAEDVQRYPMIHAVGGKYFYFFLTELERGHLQVLPLAYHVERDEWYDAPASMLRHAEGIIEDDEPLDWRDRPLTFNTACHSCHVSQVEQHYDPETDSYATVWLEPGINCETCHGPSAEHVHAARALAPGEEMTDFKLTSMVQMSPRRRDDACATCHAKARPLTPEFSPGELFFDHFDLVTLEDEDFYPDARDLGENYTHTLWLMSPCLASEQMECIHCHTSSGRFRFRERPNDSCLPCHEQRVNNPTAHTMHPADSTGNQCISCHMPMTTFAHMRRSDHSMLPPAPAATIAFQSPNACNICHTDRDAQWADNLVRRWRNRDYQAPVLHRAELIRDAREQEWGRLPEMLEYIENRDLDEITRTSLIRLLAASVDQRIPPVLRRLTDDSSPLVRSAAAIGLADDLLDPATQRALLAATADDVRLVRIRAAEALTGFQGAHLALKDRDNLERATAELKTSLTSRPDDWASQYNLGNFYFARQELDAALEAFEQALRLYPAAIPPMVNASMVHARKGDLYRSIDLLQRAHGNNPENVAINFNLGLAFAENRRLDLAEHHLQQALKHDPLMDAAAFNLGVLLAARDIEKAISHIRHAWELQPHNGRYGYTLAYYLHESEQTAQAEEILAQLVDMRTDYGDAYFLLAEIYESRMDVDDAKRVYRAAYEHRGLPPLYRQQALNRFRLLEENQ